jgi:copper transport protein
VLVPGASAHAVLLSTVPANGAVVQEEPDEVVLQFDEPVETALGSVRVYDGSGNRVDAETISRPSNSSVAVAIDKRLARGTYTVAWRVISADSDPINGAFVFHVKEPGPQPAGIAAQVVEDTPATVSVSFAAARALDYIILLLAAGGTLALGLVLTAAAPALRRRLAWIAGILAAVLVPLVLLELVLQGAAAGGYGLGEAFDWEIVRTVAETRFGEFALVRALIGIALALALLVLPRFVRGVPLLATQLALAAALLVTPVASGHASVSGAVAFVADYAHVLAAAAWTGGLGFVVLALVLARENRWPLATTAVPRFSTLAVVAVVALLVAGTINGYLQVRSWHGLWETTYGLLLLAKILLVLPLLALGAFNNRYAVPRLRRGIASSFERRRFLGAVSAELTLMTVIVAVTAVLVSAPPARTEIEEHGATETVVDLGPLDAHLTVEPAMPGPNAIRLELMEGHSPATGVSEVRVSASLPSAGIGPLRFTTSEGEPGTYAVNAAQLPIAGHWQLRIEVRRGEFELMTENVMVKVEEGL